MPGGPLVALLLVLTVAAYALAYLLSRRVRHPLAHPIPVSALALILGLHLSGLSFADYKPVKDLAGWLLGPATVALAVPVHSQRARLRALALPLLAGVTAGTLVTILAVIGLSALGRLTMVIRNTLAFKSVTTPIAIELVQLHGGDTSLVAVFVVFTGIIGALLGPTLLTRCGITGPAARGIALGTVSHVIGTVAALGESEEAGALASLAMMGAAIVTTVVAPTYIPFLLRLW
jgi:putative effector of murein hydrolase